MSNRDNFTRVTIDILAKRVGYLCSNPKCRNYTVGPSQNPEKATIIGVAAHITAASPEGPRYDATLSESQRTHIDNGIWLCSNCATLIDKDETMFPVSLLLSWKQDAENELLSRILGAQKNSIPSPPPFLEADLIWNHGYRRNLGYSNKNPKIIEDGQEMIYINLSESPPIIYWEIKWNFAFTIHNNSNSPVFNVAIENIGHVNFSSITKLSKINNLPPFKNVDLEAELHQTLEGTYIEADDIMKKKIPDKLHGLSFRITYQDENRDSYETIVEIKNNGIINRRP